jgi:hypothetical protein
LGDNHPSCAAGADDTSGSGQYLGPTNPKPLEPEQAFWRVCSRCSEVFALNAPDASNEKPCPAGQKHAPQGEYFRHLSPPIRSGAGVNDANRWPKWDGSRPPGHCPAGGTHDHRASFAYVPPAFRVDVTQVIADEWAGLGTRRAVTPLLKVLSLSDDEATVRVSVS